MLLVLLLHGESADGEAFDVGCLYLLFLLVSANDSGRLSRSHSVLRESEYWKRRGMHVGA